MARKKRYELYEGDWETIPEEEYPSRSNPGSAPLPEWLKPVSGDGPSRDARPEPRSRYNDGLTEEPYSLFDDFDRFNGNQTRESRYIPHRKRKKQTGWAVVAIICMLLLISAGVLMAPQLLGVRYSFLPNLAFANSSVLVMDENRENWLDEWEKTLYSDRIYPGIYIDDIHVGGMTREEARQAVKAAHRETDQFFDIVVYVGNENWHINSQRVPVTRNVRETVDQAWAFGRGNTADLSGKPTPLEERISRVSALRSEPLYLRTEQGYDRKALRTMVEGIVNYVNREPVNSTVESFNFSTREFTFTEDKPGARLDPDLLYAEVADRLDRGVTSDSIRMVPEKLLADMTRTELMNRFGLISAYTTTTTKDKNRNTNIDLSARAISGRVVEPGEIFSFNAATGERTAEKGYKEAPAIAGGQSRDEVGGGVCQTSSTLFNAAVRADIEILERNPHAWPSSYIEKGFDATVNYPGLDMKFRNNTEWPIFIIAGYADRKVTVNIYGCSLGQDMKIDLESKQVKTLPKPSGVNYVVNTDLKPGESKTTVRGREGCVVETWKIWYRGNAEEKRELLFTTTYKAYQETVEYNPN